MNELYELIEKKIKEKQEKKNIHVRFPEQMYMMISVIRLTEKKMGHICCFRNLRMM